MWRGKPVLFDFAQAVVASHPMSTIFLKRDLQNLNRYFKKLGVNVSSVDEMYRKVTEKNV
jgi:RIO kinase 1